MADVRPFSCIRPREDVVHEVAALPYDVYSRAEAKAEIAKHPLSFLAIDSAEATLPDSVDQYDDRVYEQARNLLEQAIEKGVYESDNEPFYYLYRLSTQDGHSQTGVVGCAAIDDYVEGTIKKHENTRANKELDRIRHVDTCSAHTGPIYLAFRSDGSIEQVMEKVTAGKSLYCFTADDGVTHTIWRVENPQDATMIHDVLAATPSLYIADGHHRAGSAVKTGLMRRKKAENNGKHLESDHFLTVMFPSEQLNILDYNRAVADLNGLSVEEMLEKASKSFSIEGPYESAFKPTERRTFGMYVDGAWYKLKINPDLVTDDTVDGLDVSLLQDYFLAPILGVDDPRADDRIDFIGGIRGLGELERRVHEDMAIAFAMYPTSIEELFAVADEHRLMPPKSTWFEPKPRSGIFIHRI